MAGTSVPSNLTVAEMEGSPAVQSAIRKWYNNIKSSTPQSAIARAKVHAKAAGNGIRQVGESAVVGAVLGAAHQQLKTGLDVGPASSKVKIPLDGALAAVGLAGRILFAEEEFAVDLGNAGAAGAAVFAFRKTHDLMQAKAAGATHAGFAGTSNDAGEDPIMKAAQFL